MGITFIVIFQSMNSIRQRGECSEAVVIRISHGGRYYFSVECVIAPWNSGGAGMASGCFLDHVFCRPVVNRYGVYSAWGDGSG